MPDQTFVKLKRSLTLHEGRENFCYVDTTGRITIGIGYNLSERGIGNTWIDQQYSDDVHYLYSCFVRDYPWFMQLNEDRQIALVDMSFMGYKKLQEFHTMLEALASHDYAGAAKAMLDSEWAREVKGRAATLSNAMLTGSYDV